MRSAAFVTLALAMISFSATGCHTIQSCHSGSCGSAGCTSCGDVINGCSSCGQAGCNDCGKGGLLGHGLFGGHGGLLGHGHLGKGHLGHGHGLGHHGACPRCGLRGLLGGSCKGCGLHLGHGAGLLGKHHQTPYTEPFAGPYGPTAPTVGYPYYTNRAPRDFLVNNPPTIGR